MGEEKIPKVKLKPKKKKFSKNCLDCDAKEQSVVEANDRCLRAQADYQNLQKEVEKNRSELARYSEQQILEEFIPVYDNLKKAFINHPVVESDEWQNWAKGIGYIMKQFKDILSQHDVEEIKTIGEQFNPEMHEAVGEEDGEDHDSGTIITEVDAGYIMKNKVFKAAKVIVAK